MILEVDFQKILPKRGTAVVLAIPPDVASQLLLNGGEKDLHITLLYFEGEIDLNVLREVIPNFAPIKIKNLGLESFSLDDGRHTLHLSVSGCENLRKDLANSCLANGLEFSTRHEYKPHITLAYLEQPPSNPELRFKEDFFVDKIEIWNNGIVF